MRASEHGPQEGGKSCPKISLATTGASYRLAGGWWSNDPSRIMKFPTLECRPTMDATAASVRNGCERERKREQGFSRALACAFPIQRNQWACPISRRACTAVRAKVYSLLHKRENDLTRNCKERKNTNTHTHTNTQGGIGSRIYISAFDHETSINPSLL